MHVQLLISSEAKSAYFHEFLEVGQSEALFLFPDYVWKHRCVGPMDFLCAEIDANDLPGLARMSFVQGMFEQSENGLEPLEQMPNWALHDDFVFEPQ